jgi:cbb3-type cytochrome oxidase cytochrome c subunit
MKGLLPLFLGVFGMFAFSWVGLALIPNSQIGHLDPQSDEEGTDVYPMPISGMAVRGQHVFVGNGCMYCHSEQVRPDYAGSDIERKWGDRRSAPRDYIFARPVLLGKMRLGPDLANVGKRAPNEEENPAPGQSPAAAPATAPAAGASPAPATPATAAKPAGSPAAPAAADKNAPPAPAGNASPAASPGPSPNPEVKSDEPAPYSLAWHHRHLYSPRSVDPDSNMPAYRFLYQKRRISGERSQDALKLMGKDAPPEGFEIVPTYEAECLVSYLMALNQSHPLKEVKSSAASAPAPAAPASPASPAPAPPK